MRRNSAARKPNLHSLRFIIVFFVFCGILLFPSAAWEGEFVIVNDTGYTIYWIYISHSSDDSWGEDRLGRDVLLTGESYPIYLSHSESSLFDIRIIDEDNDSYTFYGYDVSSGRIVVRLSHLDKRRAQ